MKKTLYNILGCLAVAAVAALTFTSCAKDDDSNPTFHKCTTPFVLNTPANAANNTYDLASASSLELTCTQPYYDDVPYVCRYYVQVALDEASFSNGKSTELKSSFTTAKMQADASEMNSAMIKMYQDAHPNEAYPSEARALYIRLRACPVTMNNTALDTVYSNIIKLPSVLAKYVAPKLTAPTEMYLVGGSIGNGSDKGYWSWWKPMAPVYGMEGEFYSIIYVPDGGAFKWGLEENDWCGYDNVTEFDDQANAGLSKDNDGNIAVANGGWYTIYVEAKVSTASILYTFHICKAEAYVIGNTTDDSNWGSENANWKLTAPAGDGVWTSPAFANAGELRAYIKVPDTDWWRTEFTIFKGDLFWRTMNIPDNWASNVGEEYSVQCTAGQKLYVNFSTNTAEVK